MCLPWAAALEREPVLVAASSLDGMSDSSREFHKPVRRPAELFDRVFSAEDPAEVSRVAHTTAHALLARVRADPDGAVVDRLIDSAQRVVGLYGPDGRQVGFARTVSDGVSFAYLADVYVLPEYRGRGLGEELVREMVEGGGELRERRWLLHTGDAHALYRKFGWGEPSERLMERPSDASGGDRAG